MLWDWGSVFEDAVYALNQHPIYGANGSRNQGVQMEVVPLIITHRDPLAKFLLSIPATLGSAGLEALAARRGMLPPENNNFSIKLKVEAATWG